MTETEKNFKIKCKGCLGEFERIFGHLRYNQDCESKYTQKEIEKLKEEIQKLKADDQQRKRQITNAKQYEKIKKIKIMVSN